MQRLLDHLIRHFEGKGLQPTNNSDGTIHYDILIDQRQRMLLTWDPLSQNVFPELSIEIVPLPKDRDKAGQLLRTALEFNRHAVKNGHGLTAATHPLEGLALMLQDQGQLMTEKEFSEKIKTFFSDARLAIGYLSGKTAAKPPEDPAFDPYSKRI